MNERDDEGVIDIIYGQERKKPKEEVERIKLVLGVGKNKTNKVRMDLKTPMPLHGTELSEAKKETLTKKIEKEKKLGFFDRLFSKIKNLCCCSKEAINDQNREEQTVEVGF